MVDFRKPIVDNRKLRNTAKNLLFSLRHVIVKEWQSAISTSVKENAVSTISLLTDNYSTEGSYHEWIQH